ncbi:MAG TPA: NAD(P)/FAD-dependent oxidoreductase [Terriglobia bacterium]|nr:NAD(P)/FAD-dependent oxidoreductase [Terriglobia bacterium]
MKRRIAIIGGGPAGAMTAEKLAHAGFEVVVFEERPGWEKPCGGGLSHKVVKRYPFILDQAEHGKLARDLEFIAADGTSLRFEAREPLVIFPRCVLNGFLLRRAEKSGARVVPERVLGFERTGDGWTLKTAQRSCTADFVILAGGARSRLRRLLAEDFSADDFMLTFGYYVPQRDDRLRIRFFEDFEGYAWAFPREDHLSVGICGKVGEDRMAGLRAKLHAFMQDFGYRNDCPVYSHLLPSLSDESWERLRVAGDGWALVGDAAGLVDPITGEGIYYALRSGELLAEALVEDSAASYPKRVAQDFSQDLAFGARVAHRFYHGRVLGKPVTTRLLELAAKSQTVMDALQDLITGSQPYAGISTRLSWAFASSPLDRVFRSFRNVFRRPLATAK